MTKQQAEEAILSNIRDKLKYSSLAGDTMLPRCHTNFIFANTNEDVQRLRFKFELKFDFVTYVLISVDKEEQLQYLDKVILNNSHDRFKILYVTVSLLNRSK